MGDEGEGVELLPTKSNSAAHTHNVVVQIGRQQKCGATVARLFTLRRRRRRCRHRLALMLMMLNGLENQRRQCPLGLAQHRADHELAEQNFGSDQPTAGLPTGDKSVQWDRGRNLLFLI